MSLRQFATVPVNPQSLYQQQLLESHECAKGRGLFLILLPRHEGGGGGSTVSALLLLCRYTPRNTYHTGFKLGFTPRAQVTPEFLELSLNEFWPEQGGEFERPRIRRNEIPGGGVAMVVGNCLSFRIAFSHSVSMGR